MKKYVYLNVYLNHQDTQNQRKPDTVEEKKLLQGEKEKENVTCPSSNTSCPLSQSPLMHDCIHLRNNLRSIVISFSNGKNQGSEEQIFQEVRLSYENVPFSICDKEVQHLSKWFPFLGFNQLLQSARLLYPWDLQGKNTGVGCHFLLQ